MTYDLQQAVAYYAGRMHTPVGQLTLVACDSGLVAVLWPDDEPNRVRLQGVVLAPRHAIVRLAQLQLGEYFAGARTCFTVPLHFRGTSFQKKVWAALGDIPFGQTRSYGDLARHVGQPTAARAVGAANGKNPIGIIAPCHRVVGTNGKLTGFAGGLAVKEYLLRLEAGAA